MAEVMANYVPQNSHSATTQTQPHEAPFVDQDNITTLSDPSSSSNSTILTGEINHRITPASSQSTESPAANDIAKFVSAEPVVPLSPMSREEQENDYYSSHSPTISSSYVAASPSPADSPTEQVKYFTAPDAKAASIQSNEIDSSQVSPPQTPNSHSPRPLKVRTRSTSSGVLARLTNRSSSYISDLIDPGSPTSSHVSGDSPSKPRLDRAALARPRGKYKSGVNWDSSPMNLAAGQEPFMEQASPPVEKTMEEVEASLKVAEMEQMFAAGSTKAAIAWSRANSFGDPIFATHRRAMAEASAKALQTTATGGTSLPASGSTLRVKSTVSRSPTDGGRGLSNVRFNSGEMNEITEDNSSRHEGNSKEESQLINTQNLITTGGQIVLESARRAAADSVDAQVISEPEKRTSPSTLFPPSEEVVAEPSTATSKLAKRKTFLGFGGKKEKEKKKGKDYKISSEDGIAEGQTTPESNEPPSREGLSRPASIKQEANGTASRKRRFNDTRQLNLLANELAAEAMMGAPDLYPSLMPETRRASMMSLLAATNGNMGASPSNTSQISLQPGGILGMPQPAFVNNEFGNRSGSPAGGSSRSGSPRIGPSDVPLFDPPRAPFARSQQSLSTPSSPLASQKAKLTGLPADMLTGLGDGPYPTLPTRGLDPSDSYMIPTAPFEGQSSMAYDQSPRSSLPDVFTRSRGASASSTPLPKRSVLQMSMHNPEAELQGLTKPPKSSRNSPFGSRAPSKQVTPRSSFVNLREKANASVSPTLLSQELAKSSLISEKGAVTSATSSTAEGQHLEGQSKKENKDEGKGSNKDARRSFFKMRSKSKTRLAGPLDETTTNTRLLSPPAIPNSTLKAQSLHSSGSENNYKSIHNQQLRAASHSAHSLVIMPSPTHSNTNTTASASSHDPNAFAYSSDGGSHQQGFSTVTTPEALPAKMELSTLSNNNTLDARVSIPSPHERLASSNERPSASPLGIGGTSNQSNRGSPNPTTPRSTSATSKNSTTASTLGRINKFKSMFASTKTPFQKASSPSPSPAQVTTTPVNHYPAAANHYPTNDGINEKVNSRVDLPLANGQHRMTSENTMPKERTFKNFQAKIQEKMII